MGGMVFNAAYALAVRVLHARLLESNIVLRVRSCTSPFWHSSKGENSGVEENIIAATFVDDQAIVLMASSPRILQRAIKVLLDILPDTFRRFRLDIN